ncbi:MAG: hypothetical protein A4E49_00610 [Methanosaeta sp. PtaU1.Bin112]|nr:MAG: hypothetical protein A4E49_00610 [Methanosaeta sp. PtaU1.Bin112]
MGKARKVYLRSSRKLSRAEAMKKDRLMKVESLGMGCDSNNEFIHASHEKGDSDMPKSYSL